MSCSANNAASVFRICIEEAGLRVRGEMFEDADGEGFCACSSDGAPGERVL